MRWVSGGMTRQNLLRRIVEYDEIDMRWQNRLEFVEVVLIGGKVERKMFEETVKRTVNDMGHFALCIPTAFIPTEWMVLTLKRGS